MSRPDKEGLRAAGLPETFLCVHTHTHTQQCPGSLGLLRITRFANIFLSLGILLFFFTITQDRFCLVKWHCSCLCIYYRGAVVYMWKVPFWKSQDISEMNVPDCAASSWKILWDFYRFFSFSFTYFIKHLFFSGRQITCQQKGLAFDLVYRNVLYRCPMYVLYRSCAKKGS